MKKLFYTVYFVLFCSGIIQAAQNFELLQTKINNLFQGMLAEKDEKLACALLDECCDFSQKNNVFPVFVQNIDVYYFVLCYMVNNNYRHRCKKCIDFFPLTKELCCQLIIYSCEESKEIVFLDMYLGYLVDKGWPYDIDTRLKDYLYKRGMAYVFWQYGACLTSQDEYALWQELLTHKNLKDKIPDRQILLVSGWFYPKKINDRDGFVAIPVYPHTLSCERYVLPWTSSEIRHYKNFFLYAECLTKEKWQTVEDLQNGNMFFNFQLMKQKLSSQEKEILLMQILACKDSYGNLIASLRFFNTKLIVECAHLLHFSAYKKWLHRIKWVAKNSRKSAAPVVVGIEEQQEKMLEFARSNYLTDIVFVKQ